MVFVFEVLGGFWKCLAAFGSFYWFSKVFGGCGCFESCWKCLWQNIILASFAALQNTLLLQTLKQTRNGKSKSDANLEKSPET